jgi:hypothetical protein
VYAFLINLDYRYLYYSATTENRSRLLTTLVWIIVSGVLMNSIALLGSMAIPSTFIIDNRLGIASLLAAAAHEVPQYFGCFAVLINGGWCKSSALFLNFLFG